jgi:hypothetical protein
MTRLEQAGRDIDTDEHPIPLSGEAECRATGRCRPFECMFLKMRRKKTYSEEQVFQHLEARTEIEPVSAALHGV